ncbi:ATP-grasp domain-containing protein [Streptacidiphilus sp. 4-A2]|nr:ATP-grasp domain-containing protein [Streptacidiphilus sp. 4-A2]
MLGWEPLVDEAFVALGLEYVLVAKADEWLDANNRAKAARLILSVADYTSVEQIVGAVCRAGLDLGNIKVVHTGDEFAVVTGVVLNQSLGLKSPLTMKSATAFRDKFFQKRILQAADVPVAASFLLERLDLLDEESAGTFPYPAVLKPAAGAASQNTSKVDSAEELLAAARALVDGGAGEMPFVVEEYIVGSEMHIDGVIREGREVLFGISKYTTNPLHALGDDILGSVILDPDEHAEYYTKVRAVAIPALRALGLTDGVFHMEMFDTESGFVFGECGARPPAGGACGRCAGSSASTFHRSTSRRPWGCLLVLRWSPRARSAAAHWRHRPASCALFRRRPRSCSSRMSCTSS